MNPYAALVRTLGRTRAFAWVASRVLPPIDVRFVGRSRSLTTLGTDFPLCYLTVQGRRTGEERTVPLLYVGDGDRVVVIASNWGKRNHPAWSFNLDAAAGATVTIHGVSHAMTSRRATDEERERYWSQALAFWPGYAGYRRRVDREIRVFVLEPVAVPD